MPESEQKVAAPGATTADGNSTFDKNNAAATSSPATKADEPTPAPTAPVISSDNTGGGGGGGDDDEDMLLVTEFPPPPYYYTLASQQLLTPPEIPHRAFRVAAKRVMAERRKAREESENIRMEAEKCGASSSMVLEKKGSTDSTVDNIIESTTTTTAASSSSTTKKEENDNDDDMDSIDADDPNETVVAVFGEIVEDPTLVMEEECHDPVEIRENVKRLNHAVLQGFLKMVQKLVHDPNDNKKLRDELSHNLFLMLQECNKFREHQAREILIETLEQQLERRKEGLVLLKKQIGEADEALGGLQKFRERAD
ncbi:hypothetical protein ACHAXR_002563 [Thalassiosira sp. AJA248-18]